MRFIGTTRLIKVEYVCITFNRFCCKILHTLSSLATLTPINVSLSGVAKSTLKHNLTLPRIEGVTSAMLHVLIASLSAQPLCQHLVTCLKFCPFCCLHGCHKLMETASQSVGLYVSSPKLINGFRPNLVKGEDQKFSGRPQVAHHCIKNT